ncbi:murein biosynthesis integral membrane protein MurJ [Humidisolicoccus flavus]|uniref:murein biosynthesis integral membrane protein MurJ n=1 Tax=Humidisolicoccus flavus TaxID=3111414 RepID=UPI003252693C
MSEVGRASALIATGTLVSRVLGFGKSIMLTAAIGATASQAGATYGLANQLPNNIYALVAGGVLSAVLVPQIVKASLREDGGQAYVNKIITLGGTVFLAITVLATLLAPWITQLYVHQAAEGESGFTAAEISFAIAIAYWCMPQIFFYAMYTLIGEIFNARKRFGPFTWAPVANNIISIAGFAGFIYLFGGRRLNIDTWGAEMIAVIGGVTTLGVVAQTVVLVLCFKRTGLTFRFDFGWRGVGLRATGQRAGWLLGVVVIGQIKGVYQMYVSSMAGTEHATVLTFQNSWYLFSLPHSIIAVSIAIAFFTRMSHHGNSGDIAAIRTDVSSALRGVGMLTTISALYLAIVAIPFARVYEAEFENQVAMAWVIWAMLICLVAFSTEYVLQRVFFALDDTKTAFFYSIFGLVVTVVLLTLVRNLPPEWIIAGCALAISGANLISAGVWLILVRRKIGAFGLKLIAMRHIQYLVYGLIAIVPGGLIVWGLGGYTDGGFGSRNILGAMTTCGISGLVVVGVYFGILYITKNPDFRSTFDLVMARFRPARGK